MKMKSSILVLLFGVAFAVRPYDPTKRTSYDGYKVVEVIPNTEDDIKLLREWMFEDTELDFWDGPSHVGKPVNILIPPSYLTWITQKTADLGMSLTITNDNVQSMIDEETARIQERQKSGKAYSSNDFNTYEDITSEIRKLARECPSGKSCSVYSIGKSYEGRDLNVLRITSSGSNRKAIWLDSAIHAREWLAPATVMRIAENLVRRYSSDSTVKSLVDRYDWYILPVMNPDGYRYTFSGDRYWRKNLKPYGGCRGADLNRNYDYRWGTEGVSSNPCSDLYCGPSAASEPETRAVQNEVMRIRRSLAALVTYHAYGRMFMHPWGNTVNAAGSRCQRASDHSAMYAVAQSAGRAIANTYNTRWTYGTSCEVIYPTTGGTDDWAKATAGVKYTFCPELRGSNFVINRSQIEPSFRENWNGIVAMASRI